MMQAASSAKRIGCGGERKDFMVTKSFTLSVRRASKAASYRGCASCSLSSHSFLIASATDFYSATTIASSPIACYVSSTSFASFSSTTIPASTVRPFSSSSGPSSPSSSLSRSIVWLASSSFLTPVLYYSLSVWMRADFSVMSLSNRRSPSLNLAGVT